MSLSLGLPQINRCSSGSIAMQLVDPWDQRSPLSHDLGAPSTSKILTLPFGNCIVSRCYLGKIWDLQYFMPTPITGTPKSRESWTNLAWSYCGQALEPIANPPPWIKTKTGSPCCPSDAPDGDVTLRLRQSVADWENSPVGKGFWIRLNSSWHEIGGEVADGLEYCLSISGVFVPHYTNMHREWMWRTHDSSRSKNWYRRNCRVEHPRSCSRDWHTWHPNAAQLY